MSLLKVENLHTYYGRVHALKGINLEVEEGQIVTLIGANGAGKSTTLRTISGLLRPREGGITFKGEPIHEMASHRIVERGICHSPEGRGILSTLTVDENLNMGAYVLGSDKEAIEANRRRVFDLFPRMEERRNQLGGTLSGGEQQMLTIARALMARPSLLMLDEPSLGLAPLLVKTIFSTVREINERGVTVLLVEQNARAALKVAHQAYVLETGRVVLSGPANKLLQDERVRKAYLGEN
ncbi:MAG: ABC transporter ATP-binding protein [Anaerolineae bacterium]|jgi:branched-chain amino acid transport system ATP-binding protein|nr:ABC transporter ATP-binding protein [Anaerolineae bacterium]MDX9832879.1 ABC transporter ATP-binding protein [Anaerolineae bacterium]